ncbi:MAG: hypothetical protein JWO63_2749 [Frankiales bacterium]|nr:hypothetical protein [Frankiales bacterium]
MTTQDIDLVAEPAPIPTAAIPTRPRRRRWSARVIGIGVAALATLLMCLGVAVTNSPLATADETGHLDYAVQVWNGHLPVFEKGVQIKTSAPAVRPPVQWEAQHPPFFYALVAPIAGPLVNAGHWIAANLAVRFVNSFIALLTVLMIAWAAGLLRPRDRGGWMISVAAVASTMGPIVFVGGSAYGDPLNGLWCAAAVGLAVLVIKRGMTVKRAVAISVLSGLGLATNAQFILALVLLVVVSVLVVLLQSSAPVLKRLSLAAAAGAAPLLAAFAAAGWFFIRNKHITGNFSGAQPVWTEEHLHRHSYSLSQVLHARSFWTTQYSLLRHPLDGRNPQRGTLYTLDTRVGITLLLVCVAAGVLVGLWFILGAGRRRDWRQLGAFAAVAAMLVLDGAFELQYSMGGGGSVSRYLIPALVPLCVLVAAGLRILGSRGQTVLLGGYLVICWGLYSAWLVRQPHPGGDTLTGAPWFLVLIVPPLLVVAGLLVVAAHARTTWSPLRPGLLPRHGARSGEQRAV